jgi:hypothetical protein
MHYPSKFGKICYRPNVFLGNQIRGITGVLCSFEHEQYPFNSVNPCCLIIEYLNDGIGFLIWLCNTFANFKIYVLEPNVFLGYPTRG